jgi:hypothetical protein
MIIARNVTSSGGEDGIVEKIFEVIIGAQNKWCVELGALNGTHDSNVWNLINNHDWSSSASLKQTKHILKNLIRISTKTMKKLHALICFVSFEGESITRFTFLKNKTTERF